MTDKRVERVFAENLNKQSARLGIVPKATESPMNWGMRVRKAAMLEALESLTLPQTDLEQRAMEMLGDHTRIKLRQAIEGPILKRMYSGALEGKAGYDGTIYIADEIIANLEALASSSVPEQDRRPTKRPQTEADPCPSKRLVNGTHKAGYVNPRTCGWCGVALNFPPPAPQDRGASQGDGRP